MADKKPWTRNQKLSLASIIIVSIMAIIGFLVKINIDIYYLQNEIENIKIETAKINQLEAKIAQIGVLTAGTVETSNIKAIPCPPGSSRIAVISPGGITYSCK